MNLMKDLSTRDNKIAAKIFQYLLNAMTDAHLADELISFLNHKDHSLIGNTRVKLLLKDIPTNNDSFIAGLAYCQYLMNGYYDYIYQFFLIKFTRTTDKQSLLNEINDVIQRYAAEIGVNDAYTEFPDGEMHFFMPMIKLMLHKIPFKDVFIKRFNISEELIDYKEFVKAMIHVQKLNISNNNKQAEAIEKGDRDYSTKIKYLFEYSERSNNPEEFRLACANTLRAASGWDIWFVRLLKLFILI